MKARIPKKQESAEESSEIYAVKGVKEEKGFRHTPSYVKMLQTAKKTINETIDEEIEGGRNRLDILIEMNSSDYLRSFYPQKRQIVCAVEGSLEEMLREEVKKILKENMKNQEIAGMGFEEIINEMESENYVEEEFGNIDSKQVQESIKNTITNFIKTMRKERLEENQVVAKKNIGTNKNQKKRQTDDANVEESKSEIQGKETDQFFDEVKEFTGNFSFLATDVLIYKSIKGEGAQKKFKKAENYFKFVKLQEKIRETMKNSRVSECVAIERLANKSCKEQDEDAKAMTKILCARKNVLQRNKKVTKELESR